VIQTCREGDVEFVEVSPGHRVRCALLKNVKAENKKTVNCEL
jgi:hypothetical protein